MIVASCAEHGIAPAERGEARSQNGRAALRIGSYQIFHSRVPRRAAVSETVEGLKQLGLSRAESANVVVLHGNSEQEVCAGAVAAHVEHRPVRVLPF